MMEACDGFPVDVGHQLVGTESCVVGWASLVHSLRRGRRGDG